MTKSDSWTTIESDPGVFTELVQHFGVSGVQFEEIYSLDPECIDQHKPIYGLIFLFKWLQEKDERPVAEDAHDVFFAQQVVKDACATQAILSVLFNCPQINLGSTLTAFKEFTADFPPELKGEAIGNSEEIRAAHNSFARPEFMLHSADDSSGSSEDAFHFVAYVPVNGLLYELDGLKPGPIALAKCTQEDWLDKVRPEIQTRMARYAGSEIRFNLMALIGDKIQIQRRRLVACQRALSALDAAGRPCNERSFSASEDVAGENPKAPVDGSDSDALAPMEDVRMEAAVKKQEAVTGSADGNEERRKDSESSTAEALTESVDLKDGPNKLDPEDPPLPTTRIELLGEISRLRESLSREESRQRQWRLENERRRHNYIPFIFNLLKELADMGKLNTIIEKAKTMRQAGQGRFPVAF